MRHHKTHKVSSKSSAVEHYPIIKKDAVAKIKLFELATINRGVNLHPIAIADFKSSHLNYQMNIILLGISQGSKKKDH